MALGSSELLADHELCQEGGAFAGQSRAEMGASWMAMSPNHVAWKGFSSEEEAGVTAAGNAKWFPIPHRPGDKVGACISQPAPRPIKFSSKLTSPEEDKANLQRQDGTRVALSARHTTRMAEAAASKEAARQANQAALG